MSEHNQDALMNCPKCGFAQPVDQYCAKCGIDMTTVPKKPKPFMSQTMAISSVAVVAIIATVAGVRATRKSSNDQAIQSVSTLASEGAAARRRERLSAKASEETHNNLAQASASYSVDAETSPEPAASEPDTAETPSSPGLAATHAATTAAPSSAAGANAARGATAEKGRLVAFAWAEVSHQWLQAMGSLEPGLHPVPDLEARLRESAGGYRIVESSRQHVADQQSVTLSRGDRVSIRFDVQSVTDTALMGMLQSSARGLDGAVRSPAAASISMERGQGAIVSFGAAGLVTPPPGMVPGGAVPAGAPPTGTEIVVLILPRWDADRNP